VARSALVEAAEQLTRALAQIATLPATPALRRKGIELQVGLTTPLAHVKGYAAPETKAALERARLLIEQAEALGEPPEDPLLLFSVLFGFCVANFVAFKGEVQRELAAQFLALAEKQGAAVPIMIGHRIMGVTLARLLAHRDRLRRRCQDKGEARHFLAHANYVHRQGRITDRTFENQSYRASGLNLAIAAIAHWNTVCMQRAVRRWPAPFTAGWRSLGRQRCSGLDVLDAVGGIFQPARFVLSLALISGVEGKGGEAQFTQALRIKAGRLLFPAYGMADDDR
jgi:Tn3 transposase DDE domain